jgi:NAD(P)-dependent dehydrogenase (short-subunit alcohol dehydrogenase family)
MASPTAPSVHLSLAEIIDLSGRTAIVTGGAMGIGRGIVRRLAEAGANLVVADLDLRTFRHVIDVNLTGLCLCTRAAAAQMIEQGRGGRIVNAIAPGGIRTPGAGDVDEETLADFAKLIPMGRLGDPDEIGRAALFFASDIAWTR